MRAGAATIPHARRRWLTLRWRGVSAAPSLRALVVTAGLLLAAIPVLVVSLGVGDYPISPADVVRTLLGEGTPQSAFIVETLRLPRVLDALLVGAALGVAGAIFQSVTRNPLGSPDVIGFTQGAAAGAVLELLVFGGGTLAVAAGAVAGGGITAALVYLLAYRNGLQGYRLVLVGIGFSSMLAALTAYLIVRADRGGRGDAIGARIGPGRAEDVETGVRGDLGRLLLLLLHADDFAAFALADVPLFALLALGAGAGGGVAAAGGVAAGDRRRGGEQEESGEGDEEPTHGGEATRLRSLIWPSPVALGGNYVGGVSPGRSGLRFITSS